MTSVASVYGASGECGRPWLLVRDPSWPSPYFAELARHSRLAMESVPDLDDVAARPGPPGVINLHRLKRLYRGPDGSRTAEAAKVMLARLRRLRSAGWAVVWTVHNLLPIDGGAPTRADHLAAHGVLRLADAVVAHTHADAAHLRTLTSAPVTVAGWGGLSAPDRSEPLALWISELLARMRATALPVLILGNLTAYKDLPATTRAFLTSSDHAHLYVVGAERETGVTDTLRALAHEADGATSGAAGGRGRLHVHPGLVPADAVHELYRAAAVALCPYRADGPWQFFTKVLHPSSVGTAVAFGTPVIAPNLPAIREITTGTPRQLYPLDRGPGPALTDTALAELRHRAGDIPPSPGDGGAARWRAIGAAYAHLNTSLWDNS